MEREIVPEARSRYAVSYHCSQCGWSFAYLRLSFILEFLEEREAQANFRRHRCADFPSLRKQA
jgi:hypothetical protein